MARQPRIHFPGALYHVILRGNSRQDIFFEDDDRYRFYLLLQEGVERFGHRIHAFCLMTNHIHLAIQVGNIPLSRIMQNLSFRYTRWINWRQKRSGHLFQGRFKAVVVDSDTYLLELAAYILLNPVRCGMVKLPSNYRWSSHRCYLGKETIPWLSTEPVLGQFGKQTNKARKLYETFVHDRINEGHRKEFHYGEGNDSRFLAQDTFVETILRQTESETVNKPTLYAIIAAVEKLYELKEGEMARAGQGVRMSEARSMAAWAVLELSDATLTDLGGRIGRDVTSVSSSVRRFLQRAKMDEKLQERMRQLKSML